MRPDRVGLGGFDSHTLPPTRPTRPTRTLQRIARALREWMVRDAFAVAAIPILAVAFVASPIGAQSAEGARAGIERPPADTIVRPPDWPPDVLEGPPITPRRAFFTSLLLPGAGQARLDRPYAGGVFLLIEAVSLTLMHRSAEDLRIARSFRGDSMPARYQVDPTTGLVARDADGAPIVTAWETSRYNDNWVRTRRLHLEDWTAVLIFNHLFAGADAFVAAQLWDLPAKVAIRQTPFGPAIAATFRFGRRP